MYQELGRLTPASHACVPICAVGPDPSQAGMAVTCCCGSSPDGTRLVDAAAGLEPLPGLRGGAWRAVPATQAVVVGREGGQVGGAGVGDQVAERGEVVIAQLLDHLVDPGGVDALQRADQRGDLLPGG